MHTEEDMTHEKERPETDHSCCQNESGSATPTTLEQTFPYRRETAIVLVTALITSLVTATALGHRPLQLVAVQTAAVSQVQHQQVMLPWGTIGAALVREGVIDETKWRELYSSRGGLTESELRLLASDAPTEVVIDVKNAQYFLNLLWAVGLGNKHAALMAGPMQNPEYGGAGNFASTGGWTLAKGDSMQHYSMHNLVSLTEEQGAQVSRVAENIYRPCCNNATHFPDCNHGMAMLGMLELLASKGATDDELYQAALAANTLWFPEQYATIAGFIESRGLKLSQIPAKELVGKDFASASGFQAISKALNQGGGGGSSCAA